MIKQYKCKNMSQFERRVGELGRKIARWRHLWGNSERLRGWVYELDLLIFHNSDLWFLYCKQEGIDSSSSAYDYLA